MRVDASRSPPGQRAATVGGENGVFDAGVARQTRDLTLTIGPNNEPHLDELVPLQREAERPAVRVSSGLADSRQR